MANSKSGVTVNTIGLGTILGTTFVILKLCKVIDWKWIWVLAPFWIGIATGIVFLVLTVLFVAILAAISNR